MWTLSRRDTLYHLAWAAIAACAPTPRRRVASAPSKRNPGVTLVQDGRATAAIFVAASVMMSEAVKTSSIAAREAEAQRVRLRDSVLDLARTLERVSGGRVDIVARRPTAGDVRVPILIGELAVAAFGALAIRAPFKQGFRVVASARGVGLIGESDLATSYAIYELLDRLGCRWFMPSDMGEVLPSQSTIVLPETDFSYAPSTTYRGVWYADDAYRRRNRHGGLLLQTGQTMESYLSREDRAKHPEWIADVRGRPDAVRLKWSNAALAGHLADVILDTFHKDPAPSYTLSPEDGFDFDESNEDHALDAGDFDPVANRISLTDRLLVLCNRVATQVTAKAPDVLLGMLAYAQYTRPPIREKLHPSIVPQIAPILYSRFHPMNDDTVPGNRALRNMILTWGRAARQTSFYAYGYNLAEPAAPQPMLAKWAFDVPFILAAGCKFWQPETLPNFEMQMQAHYMATRLAWNTALRPHDILDEVHTLFYGHAAPQMDAYWRFIDDVWVKTPEYAGSAYGYQRRWTRERLQAARALLRDAHTACRTPMEGRRVQLADDSLELFERFMKMRFDLAEGAFRDLGDEAHAWRRRVLALADQYSEQHCFSRTYWAPATVGALFFKEFFQRTYDDASSIARDFDILTPSPLRHFRWQIDPDLSGEGLGWARTAFDDHGWKTTDVCEETWSSLGYHDYFKSMWYRADASVAAGPGKTYLWISATDGSAKVFINGTHVSYVDEHGAKPAFEGFSSPASFDISAAVTPGSVNRIAILCSRTALNELGTGGLLGPVVLYRSKRASDKA